MKIAILYPLALAAVLLSVSPARAQEQPSDDSYEFLMARLAAGEGDFDTALARINRVIAHDPKDPVLLYERAMMLIDAGRIEKAESELRLLATNNPDFYDANRVIGRILLDRADTDMKRLDEALKFLQAAYRVNPDDISSGIAVSQILSARGDMAGAEKVLSTLVERAPDQRAINFAYAQVLTKLGRGAEAQKYLERVVAIDPTFPPAVMQLLDTYQAANEWQKAAEVLEPMVQEEGVNVELRRQQAFMYLRAGDAEKARLRLEPLVKADPQDIRSLFYLAEALNDLDQYEKAEQIYRKLLVATPNDPDVMVSFGMSLAGQKKWDEAAQTFNTILGLPNVPPNLGALARTQLAYIDLQKGNNEAAFSTAKSTALFRDKPNTQAINIALEALRRQKKYDGMVEFMEPLSKQFGTDPFIAARYVEALVRAGQKEKAREYGAGQVKLGTRNTIAVAEAWVQAGEFAPAIETIAAGVAAKPDDLDLRFQLGTLYERSGDSARAEQTFLGLLEKSPNHAPTLNYLGYMWAEAGRNLDRAHEMLTRAVGQEPDNGAYVDSLGWVYYRLGKLDQAEKYLTEAVRLEPRDPTVAEHLGDVLAKRGDVPRALEQYRNAVSLDPEAKGAEKLRSKIAELERKGQSSSR